MTESTGFGPRDEAADAAQFLSRMGYALLALAAPAGVVLHQLAIFVVFPIGVALIAFAAVLDPPGHVRERLATAFSEPPVYLGLAWLGWAALSLLWTPFPAAGAGRLAELVGFAFATAIALSFTRANARATDLYVFPIGLAMTIAVILAAAVASRQGAAVAFSRIDEGGMALAALLFPAMGGLAARARNGYARLLMILALIFAYGIGSSPTTISMFAGFAALSFALADLRRTARDLGFIAAGLIGLAPLIVVIAAPVARLMMNAKLPTLPAPFPELAFAFHVVEFDWVHLITGHGIATVAGGVAAGALPPETPRTALFQIWYEYGIVGGFLAAAGVGLAFRAMSRFPPRLAPFLMAAFVCNLALGMTRVDFDDATWLAVLAIAVIASDIAARSQYRTTRPAAEFLASL